MRKYLLYISMAAGISFFLFSCESSVENKIDGSWRMINVGNLSDDEYVEWNLMDGYIYMLDFPPNNGSPDTLNFGNYTIKIKRFTRYLELSECSVDKWNGEWKIDKCNNKYLVVIRHEYGLEYFEFVK